MECLKCKSYTLSIPNDFNRRGCQLWTDYRLGIKRLPIDTRCPGCDGHAPITHHEFLDNINKYGPKNYGIGLILIGTNEVFGGVIVSLNNRCAFYQEK